MTDLYIAIKLTVAMIISIVPLFFWLYIRPKSKKDGTWKNSFELTQSNKEIIGKLKKKSLMLVRSFCIGLECSKGIRKLYVFITLLSMLIVEIIDTNVSRQIAKIVIEAGSANNAEYAYYEYLHPALTHPVATISSFIITFSLLSYKIGNYFLTKLHNSNMKFILLSVAVVLLYLLYGGRFTLLGEVLMIMLTASCYYPNISDESYNTIPRDYNRQAKEGIGRTKT